MVTTDPPVIVSPPPRWAIVEIMGHRVVAGRLVWGEVPYDRGVAVDVPLPDGRFLQEFYGAAAVFSVRLVPEEVARREATEIAATLADVAKAKVAAEDERDEARSEIEHLRVARQQACDALEKVERERDAARRALAAAPARWPGAGGPPPRCPVKRCDGHPAACAAGAHQRPSPGAGNPGARPRIVVRSAAMNFDDLLGVYRAWLLIFGEDTAIMHAGAEVELD